MSKQVHLCACQPDALPDPIDVGAAFSMPVRIACPHGCDLDGHEIALLDARGQVLARSRIAWNGQHFGATLTGSAPSSAGAHHLAAVLQDHPGEVTHALAPTPLVLATKAHATAVHVWDVPATVAAGEPAHFRIGARCACGCSLAGRPVGVVDETGTRAALVGLEQAVWPGTEALYYAEVEAVAPDDPGRHAWRAEFAGFDDGLPHAPAAAAIGLRVVAAPELEVTVEAVDRLRQAPIRGLHVLMHPYRAVTDETGTARLRVTRGRYTLVVSGQRYVPHTSTVEATADLTTRAELWVEPEGDEYFRQ